MRKIIPSILIALILVNLFAPFTLGVNSGKIFAKKSVAEANKDLAIKPHITATDKLITIKLDVTRLEGSDNHPFVYIITDKEVKLNPEVFGGNKNPAPLEIFSAMIRADNDLTKIFSFPTGTEIIQMGNINLGMSGVDKKTFTIESKNPKIKPNTEYYLNYFSGSWDGMPNKDSTLILIPNLLFKTPDAGQTLEQDLDGITAGDGYMPACWIGLWSGGISVSGCIAQLLYTLFFRPTSFLFALAGMFFDWTLDYSVKDSSYTTAFVTEGWGVVRDFVNLFFIFVLLWIAFSTILNLHGFKTKEMIINVVLIGLLMNFSLFITKVIIDASNITARVFYNTDNIKLKDKNGKEIVKEAGKPIGLSEVIVSKVDPQRLILDASQVGQIPDRGEQINTSSERKTEKGISNGTFILVTLLASAVNVVGMIVFLMTGLIFIARVIGLWIAMILVPLAFFSYMVPVMQNVKMIGWKQWWPNTIKLAFLAPIFVFFMYLIVKFLGTDFLKDLMGGSEYKESAEFVIAIIVPFAFIMILMNRAKGIAVDFAGEIGSAVTKAAVVGGGALIGGAALTAAFAGRQTVGAVSKYIQNDAARNKDRQFGNKVKGHFTDEIKNKWNPIAYLNAARKTAISGGKALTANTAVGLNKIGRQTAQVYDVNTRQRQTVVTREGWFKRQDKAAGEKGHSEHVLNEAAAQFTGDKTTKYKELTETEQVKVRKNINKDLLSKEAFGVKFEKLSDANKTEVQTAVNNYHATGETGHLAANINGANHEVEHSAKDMVDLAKADQSVGEFVQSLRKGSYDIRNLSKAKPSGVLTAAGVGMMAFGGAGIIPILGAALAASASSGIKSGLKSGLGGLDSGTSQKDFLKDLGHTLTEAMKHAKLDVKLDSGGHGDKGGGDHGDSHGGGGHH